MFSKSEIEEIKKTCNERKITPEKLLEKKLAPFNEKISQFKGQLIGALTRGYSESSSGMNPVWYSQRETLYAGIITPETRFPFKGEMIGSFLLGINKSCSLELGHTFERDFYENKNGGFFDFNNLFGILYFLDKPPVVPEDSYTHGCFGSHSTTFQTKKPRLELYLGDKETIPFLQQLEGWRYVQLQKLLNYYLPITEEITKKIEKEQLSIFDKIRKTEFEVHSLIKEKEKRLGIINQTDGVISHGAYLELTDEFVENMKYNPSIKEGKNQILDLLKTAIKREYHENGKKTERKLDSGVIMQIDLKEFFSNRKEMFKL